MTALSKKPKTLDNFIKLIVTFPEFADTFNFVYGALMVTDVKTSSNYMLLLDGLEPTKDKCVFESTFATRTAKTDAFAALRYDFNDELTSEMLSRPDGLKIELFLKTSCGDKPSKMELMVDLRSLVEKGEDIKFLTVNYIQE